MVSHKRCAQYCRGDKCYPATATADGLYSQKPPCCGLYTGNIYSFCAVPCNAGVCIPAGKTGYKFPWRQGRGSAGGNKFPQFNIFHVAYLYVCLCIQSLWGQSGRLCKPAVWRVLCGFGLGGVQLWVFGLYKVFFKISAGVRLLWRGNAVYAVAVYVCKHSAVRCVDKQNAVLQKM